MTVLNLLRILVTKTHLGQNHPDEGIAAKWTQKRSPRQPGPSMQTTVYECLGKDVTVAVVIGDGSPAQPPLDTNRSTGSTFGLIIQCVQPRYEHLSRGATTCP